MENKQFNPVGWFEIYVEDMERARRFYETILEVRMEQLPAPDGHDIEMTAFPGDMGNAGASGALVKMKGAQVGGGNVIIYFASEDCSLPESRVVAAGGKVCQPKMPIGEYGYCSIVSDTEGNVIGLHSMR